VGAWLWRWWDRLNTRLNYVGGCLTVLFSLAGIVLTLLTPQTNSWVSWLVGWAPGAAGVCYLFWEMWRTMPPRLNPEQLRNRRHTLEQLATIRKDCVTVALVGAGQTGKTTLREWLTGSPPRPQREPPGPNHEPGKAATPDIRRQRDSAALERTPPAKQTDPSHPRPAQQVRPLESSATSTTQEPDPVVR
jgi:hypothetical protein